MSDSTVALARRWFNEVWNNLRAEVVDKLAAADLVGHHEDRETRSREEWKKLYEEWSCPARVDT